MAELSSPLTGSPAVESTEAAPAQIAETEDSRPVTRAEFRQAMSRIDGQSKVLNVMNGHLAKLTAPKSEAPKAETRVTDANLVESVAEIKAEQALIREAGARQQKAQIRQDFMSVLLRSGVPEAIAEDQADLLLIRNGDSVSADENLKTWFKSGEGEQVPLKQYAEAWLQTDRGRAVVPAKRNPSTAGVPEGVGTPSGGKTILTKAGMLAGKYTANDFANGIWRQE